MSAPPPLNLVFRGHSEEEEEEEELGVLSSSPSSTALAKKTHDGDKEESKNTSAFTQSASRRTPDVRAIPGEEEDEFAIDIAYVATKRDNQHSNIDPPSARPNSSSSTRFSNHSRRQGIHTMAGASSSSAQAAGVSHRKTSLADSWNSSGGETLGTYQGSDLLDDSDRMKDEAEYEAWKKRDSIRRKYLLE